MAVFECDLAQPAVATLGRPWEHTVGSGHAPLALRADWQAQLRRCHTELGIEHVRLHGILSDPMGTLLCQDEQFLYSFFNADQIMDFLLTIGMRPYVELSFMPQALASGDTKVYHYQANVTPPRDYGEWGALMRRLVRHWVQRYGAAEVSRWPFEVWNEPNMKSFWAGSQADYFHLYQATVEAIKSVEADLPVGGPATAQNAWLSEFLDFCEHKRLPVDFLSTHFYPTDAVGQMATDTTSELAKAPRDVMRRRAQAARAQAGERPLYYSEWNITSNPRDQLHDEPFAAAMLTHILLSVHDLVEGYSFWTFSDIFEENYFPSMPFQGGFGLLNLQGVAKPSYRAFQLLHRLGPELLAVAGMDPTVEAWAARRPATDGQGPSLTWVLTNYAAPWHCDRARAVEGSPRAGQCTRQPRKH